jgi:hypothetical protein
MMIMMTLLLFGCFFYIHIYYNMSTLYSQAHLPNAILKSEQPSVLGGEISKYQSTGGNGYGFDGKEIKSGVMEFSSYKTGGSKKRKQKKSLKRKRGSKKRRRSGKKRC